MHSPLRGISLALILWIGCLPAQEVLTNETVVKMVKAGLGEELIVSLIAQRPGRYSTSAEDLIALKKAGVPERVMAAMISKAAAEPARQPPPRPSAKAAAPPAAAPAAKPPAPAAAPNPLARRPAAPQAGRKQYQHPIGFTFSYPANWNTQQHAEFLQLIPPDVRSTPEGAAEVYLIVSESVAGEGITNPGDPRVVEYLETQVRGLSASLRRTGEPTPIETGGRGALISWEGSSPRGDPLRAQAYTAILSGYGVALVAVGLRDAVDARQAALREIFGSFVFGEGRKDERLVGVWLYEKNFWAGTYSSTNVRTYTFRPDGTFAVGGQFVAGMTNTDAGGNVTGRTSGSSGTSKSQGRWAAAGGKLHLFFDDGTESEMSYYIEDQSDGRVMLIEAGGDKQLWTYKGR